MLLHLEEKKKDKIVSNDFSLLLEGIESENLIPSKIFTFDTSTDSKTKNIRR